MRLKREFVTASRTLMCILKENTIIAMKNILVTGGAGFIGSNLIKRFFADVKGATIVYIDNMNAYYDVSLKDYRLAQLKVES